MDFHQIMRNFRFNHLGIARALACCFRCPRRKNFGRVREGGAPSPTREAPALPLQVLRLSAKSADRIRPGFEFQIDSRFARIAL